MDYVTEKRSRKFMQRSLCTEKHTDKFFNLWLFLPYVHFFLLLYSHLKQSCKYYMVAYSFSPAKQKKRHAENQISPRNFKRRKSCYPVKVDCLKQRILRKFIPNKEKNNVTYKVPSRFHWASISERTWKMFFLEFPGKLKEHILNYLRSSRSILMMFYTT